MRYRTQLFVDLNLLGENFVLLKSLCPKNEILFMVKADGYGHGMIPIVRFVAAELGIKEFGCATLGEATKIREELPNFPFDLYVFSDIQFGLQRCSELYVQSRIFPVISNQDDLDFILGNKLFKNFPICLKFNTGMNRLGLEKSDTELTIDKLKKTGRKSVFHLMSHFSSTSHSIKANGISKTQYKSFLEIKNYFLESGIEVERSSMANSGAIEQNFALEETHIRPGLMLYGPSGLSPNDRHLSQWRGKNISRLETYIINTFAVKKGQPIGYGAVPVPSDGKVILIALGYGDGFSTRFQGARLRFDGIEGEVFGQVNMDMAQIFFSPDAPSSLKLGEKIEIWGHQPENILNFSDQTKTIPYELFCQLTNRVPRIYGYGANNGRVGSNI